MRTLLCAGGLPLISRIATIHPPLQQPNRRSFVLVAFVLMLTQLGFYFTAAALPLYLRALGAAQSRVGFEVGLGNVSAVILTLVVGPGINRFGGRVFLVAGGALYLAAALGMWLIPQEGAVATFRILQGAGSSVMVPSAFTLGARLLPARRTTAISLMSAGNNIALAFGPALGLALYGWYGAAGLFAPACAAAALGLVSALLIPRQPRDAAVAGFGFDRTWVSWLVANALAAVYFGGIVAYLPLYLHQAHGPNAGIFFTADALGVFALNIPTGMLADRYGSLVPKLLGIAVTVGGLGALAMPPSLLGLILGGAGTGIGAGLFLTGIIADLATHSTDANRGTAMSLRGASFNAGIFVGGSISGLLIGPGGFHAILLLGALTTVAALPFALTRPREPIQMTG